MTEIIRIVCDGKNGRFKHVEDANYQRVEDGQWHEREDGFWEKRIFVAQKHELWMNENWGEG